MIIESFIADFLKPEAEMKQLQHVLLRTWEQRCHLFTLRKKKRPLKQNAILGKQEFEKGDIEKFKIDYCYKESVINHHMMWLCRIYFSFLRNTKKKNETKQTESAKFRKVASPWREDQTPLSNNKDLLKDLSEPLNSGLHRAIKYHP